MLNPEGEWRQARWFFPGFLSAFGAVPVCLTLLVVEPFLPLGAVALSVLLILITVWVLVLRRHLSRRRNGPARHRSRDQV